MTIMHHKWLHPWPCHFNREVLLAGCCRKYDVRYWCQCDILGSINKRMPSVKPLLINPSMSIFGRENRPEVTLTMAIHKVSSLYLVPGQFCYTGKILCVVMDRDTFWLP